ncbi:Serine/threonine-protein kinase SRPK [Pseudocercospora fuligena]|uniref:non-specific serine/threonine protein kinase n=1 Tax=Pseudocercospora fuligena TaxID=685502 RepID=A0A8H6RCS8_9PEZI|nr:Serine/threonine-protein kinase SRPK [Pseudocercospora fuligena]
MTDASPPRSIPDIEADQYEPDVLLEEESFSWYDPQKFYPVRIGEVIHSRYQVLVKLGYGSVSTAWLCRDLSLHRYVTLKVYMVGHRQSQNEVKVLRHLDSVKSDHPGAKLVRRLLDNFELPGQVGLHTCIVHEPLSLSLKDIREMAGGQVPENILKPLVYAMLLALDYLHSVAHVVHTDIQEGNFMLSINDPSILDTLVEEEHQNPSPCKKVDDRIIYSSVEVEMPDDPGQPVVCDFGDAQFGPGPFAVEVMPDLYRAPEIVLGIAWDEKIDIWGFGLMVWDLLEGKHLFTERLPSREGSSMAHLARTISLLGPPPAQLLSNASESGKYFDNDGNLKDRNKMSTVSLDEEEVVLEGDSKSQFLSFIQKMLQWRAQDRPTASELLKHPWLQSS